MKGTIKTLVAEKGFGFIATQEGEAKDIFFHRSKVGGKGFEGLTVGEVVTFDIVQGDKGPAAENVLSSVEE